MEPASIGPTTVVDYSFTVPEAMYIGFIIKKFKGPINNGMTYLFLGANQNWQNNFTQYVKNNFEIRRFSIAELELNPIVTSIWEKTKLYVQNTLEQLGKDADLVNEAECLNNADDLARERQNGHPGRMITARQAKILIHFAGKSEI